MLLTGLTLEDVPLLLSLLVAVDVIIVPVKVTEMPPRFKSPPREPVDGSFWLSGEGAELIDWCEGELGHGALFSELLLRLKARFGSLGLEALELATGRFKTRDYAALPQLALVHRESFEQSSKPPFNDFHAHFFDRTDIVLEVGTGLGLDTIALAKVVDRVISLEPNSQRAEYGRANFEALGICNIEVHTATLEESAPLLQKATAIFADPSRRKGGERVRDPNDCSPALDTLIKMSAGKKLVVKLSPTVGDHELSPEFKRFFVGSEYDARELVVTNCTPDASGDRMIIVDSSGVQHAVALRIAPVASQIDVATAKFIYESHPISLSAFGGIRQICADFNLSLLTSEHGYLASVEEQFPGPWCRKFKVLETVPYREQRLQGLVDKHTLTKETAIKKREHKVNPDALHRALKWHKPEHVTAANKFALICIDSGTNQWCSLVTEI